MVAVAEELAASLARMYEEKGDADLAEFIDNCRRMIGPEELAELIDADGRLRLDRGLPVTLSRYLDAIPDLASMPVALDAAIEFTLRSIGGDRTPPVAAVASLIAEYPMFERAIRAASLLSEALWSTEQVRADARPGRGLTVPSDFGPALPSGQRRYELREALGSGAQGGVYLAVDRHLSDRSKPAWVAIKVLRQHVGDAIGRDRLIEEATRARRIDHPNIVRVLDRGVSDDGDDYIVYEYVDGSTLREWRQARGEALGQRVAAELVAKIARGVQAAHSVGVVHCDIKPDNIMITRAGEPKVTDFGLAVRIDIEADVFMSRPSDGPMGNLGFIAPEQYRLAEGAIAPPADVYACGGILYYLLTGLLPNGQSVEEVERNLDATDGRSEPPSLREARPDIDPDLEAICRRALAPRCADRYGSAEALANDLEAWLRREPIRWTRPSVSRRVLLFCRREPLAVAMLLALMAIVGVGSGLGVALSREAERRVMQEKIEAAAEIQRQTEEYYERQTSILDSLATSVRKGSNPSGLGADWLAIMLIFETVLGPELTERSEQWAALRQERIDRLRSVINEEISAGRGKGLEALLWESMLGYHLLRDERFDEAIEVLTRNRAAFAARLDPDDLYLTMIDQMLACGRIMRSAAMPREQRKDPAVLAEVRRATEFLERTESIFQGRRSGDALHRLVVECLVSAYGQGMLDIPDRASAARKRFIQMMSQSEQ